MQKYCSNCGASIEQQSNYCNNCGVKISFSREIDHDEDSLGLKNQNFIAEEDVIHDDLINPDEYIKSFVDETRKSKSNNKSIIITISVISVIFISLVILSNVTLPILRGDQTIYVDQYTEYKDQGLNFSSIHNPSVRVTGLPDTTEPGRYTITYRFTNFLGFDSEPIYRTVIVQEVDPIQAWYNYIYRLEQDDINGSNNITCQEIGQTCVINNLDGVEMRIYTSFSPESDKIRMAIFPYIGEFYDILFTAEVYYKDGYMIVSDCSFEQNADYPENKCSLFKYNYFFEYFERTGIFTRIPADEVGPMFVDYLDFQLFYVDSSTKDLYRYYN
jgi:hypothetical protein